MRDVLTKLSILWDLLRNAFDGWREYVWKHDLDARYCCDGRECGCDGTTVRELYRLEKGKGADEVTP